MTSNERKIIKCLWDKKGEAHVRVVSDACGLTSDYTRLLCRSLARTGYLKFEDANVCRLLKKGRGRFEVASITEMQEPPVAVTANVTMLADELIVSSGAGEQDTDDKKSGGDDENTGQPPVDDGELDKVLADVGVSYPFQKNEEASEKNEEVSKVETSPQNIEESSPVASSELPASGGEAIGSIESQVVTEIEPKEPEVLQATEPVQAQAVSVEPLQIAEEKIADSPAPVASSENPEKVAPKEESAKPSGSGWSFKKIVNWFAEKK